MPHQGAGRFQALALGLLALASLPTFARSLPEIRQSGTLRICVAGSSAPLYKANGEAFARHLGVRAEVRELAAFDEQFQNADGVTQRDGAYVPRLFADGTCDLFPNDLHIVDWRTSKMLLVPYYRVRNVVVTRRELFPEVKEVSQLAGRSAAVLHGTNYDDWMQRANQTVLADKPIRIMHAPTADAVRMVADGKADFTINGTESALRWVRDDPERLVIAFPVGEPVQVGWGVPRAEKALAAELERFFGASRHMGSSLDANWRKYYGTSLMEYYLFEASFAREGIDLEELLRWAIPAGLAALLVVGAMLFWNRRLKREVEARKRITAKLAETEQWYRSVLESAPDGMIVIDEAGTIHLVNRGMQDVFGYAPGALAGQEVGMLLPEELRAQHGDLIRMFFRAPAHRAMGTGAKSLEGLRADGKRIPLEISLSPLPPVEGRTTMVAASIRNVTERKEAERALAEARAEQDAMFESATAGIAFVRDRVIQTCNRRLEEIFGYGPRDFIGKPTRIWYPSGEEHARGGSEVYEELARGETHRREQRLMRKDGSVFWCRLAGRAIEPAAPAKGSVWLLLDVTAEHEADEALREAKRVAEEATRAKSMFLASMSHEIRTPMNGVLGMLQVLGLTRLDTEQKATLDTVRDSAHSLLRIIDDVLDFSKIEAGRLEIRPEATAIAGLIESVQRAYSGVAAAKDLQLRVRVDPRVSPALSVDPLRLRQILNNFVSNAIKFTEKGSVEIGATRMEHADGRDVVRFHVTDTGIGVSMEAQAKLFQPYVQAAIDTTRRFGGTGLGLTICRRLADMMGGAIAMQSAPGKGTTMAFTVALPIADPKDVPKPAAAGDAAMALVVSRRQAPTVEAARAEGTLVLLVEDHPTNREVLTRLLNLLGYAVMTADNGRQGLGKWRAERVAIVITDCDMPEMDGYQLARTIRAQESGGASRTPVIACTANALADDFQKCTAAGMDDFLPKPVALEALATVMERWLPLRGAGHGPLPAKTPKAAADAPIDRSALAQVSGGDPAMERTILERFRNANRADMAALREALAQRDMALVAQSSHRVKGACRMVGAVALAGVCERMEKAARAKSRQHVAAEQAELEREFERLDAWLVKPEPVS